MTKFIGLDSGTYNLVKAERNTDGEVIFEKKINAFVEIPLDNRYMFNMLKNAKVPIIEKKDVAYIPGEAAVNMAYSMPNLVLRRPMAGGCLNPKEKEAFFVMSIMLHSLVGRLESDRNILYYTIPANAVNKNTDIDYHNKILESIFKKYNIDGKTIDPHYINEAMCVVYSELQDKQYTGIGISFGGGSVNVAYSMYGVPLFTFAIINSGDWINEQSALATSENVNVIDKVKMQIDLTKSPNSTIERAIHTQYRIMLEKTILGIKKGIEENNSKFNSEEPITVVVTGGTASPNGFEQWFMEVFKENMSNINIGEVIKPKDNLFTVARGALLAAENSAL